MSDSMWGRRPPPRLGAELCPVWSGEPTSTADATALRLQLRVALLDGFRQDPAQDEDRERLLLAFEELTSNGLRHGRAPVRVEVTTVESGWLLDVSDAAVDGPPLPAFGRDPADGGLGLHLVAGMSASHGWAIDGARKHVWSHIAYASAEATDQAASLPQPRGRGTDALRPSGPEPDRGSSR